MRLHYCLILFMLASCHVPDGLNPTLAYADSLMEQQPDSMLHYLQRLDVSDFSDGDKAYYGLLLTQATDKNYLPLLPCDSLVDAALNYYDEGDGLFRAKALLYKGRIQESMNMPEEAMKSCFSGLSVLGDAPKELRLKRMLYEDLGGVYQKQNLDEKGLEMFKLSYRCDSLLNDESLLKYSLANIGWAHLILDHEDMAKRYLDKALQISLKQSDSQFVSNIYSKLSLNSENIDSSLMYIRLAQNYQTSRGDSVSLYLSLGDLFLEKNELDSAEHYLKKVLDANDFERSILAFYSLSELEKSRGNYEQAFNYRSFYGEHIDSVVSLNRMSGIERLAYKHESEVKMLEEKTKTERLILYITSASVVLFLLFLLIIQYIHRRKKIAKLMYEQHIARLNEQIALHQLNIEHSTKELVLLRQTQQQNKDEIALKEQEIRSMIDEKATLRNWFFMQTPIYKRMEDLKYQESMSLREACVLLDSEQQLLKETIFQIYDEYVQYLRSTYPKLTEEDCIYCCLQLCQLDDQTIAYCFGNIGKQVVAQRRLRLKKKMEIVSAE